MNDDAEELAILPATTGTLRTLVDGTLRLTVEFEPKDGIKALKMFPRPGIRLHCSLLNQETEKDLMQKECASLYCHEAKELRLSGFFMRPDVWKRVGTDDEFLTHLRQQPCLFCRADGPSEAAHVRRIANGAGIGIKPQYSAIPLCHECHAKQHSQGESVFSNSEITGKDLINRKRIHYVTEWAWGKLKNKLGYKSFTEMPPAVLKQWAIDNEVVQYLPREYKEGV